METQVIISYEQFQEYLELKKLKKQNEEFAKYNFLFCKLNDKFFQNSWGKSTFLDELDLSTRTYNCLKANFENFKIYEFFCLNASSFLVNANFGRKSLRELMQQLEIFADKMKLDKKIIKINSTGRSSFLQDIPLEVRERIKEDQN
jgi:DNA-directed RNA polymerase alpha subunit